MTLLGGREPVPEFAELFARMWETRDRRHASPLALRQALDPGVRRSPALDAIDRAVVELTDAGPAEPNALGIELPPQEGKSQECSRGYPEWLLDHNPALRVAIVSYELDIALRWGRDTKQDVTQYRCPRGQACADPGCPRLHIDIRRDSSAAGRWETTAGGGVYCVGIGGPLTGRPVDVMVIDDPVKDRAAAESKTIRQATWDWFESVALSRLAPGAKVVLVQTRWHQDDLAGRIAARPSPLRWRRLTIPAIATGPNDPLGRAPGEELVSVRGREPGHFRNLQATLSHYVFSGVYQQNPAAAEGNFFRRATFRYWRPLPPWPDGRERIDCEGQPVTLADCWRFATADPAASTSTSADYTVVAVWAVPPGGDLILLDRRRKRVETHDHFGMVAGLRDRWRFDQVYVERSWFGKTLVKDAQAAGVPVAEVVADTDKVTRAIPAAGRLHAGKVWFPAETSGCECGNCAPLGGAWLEEWCDELAVFDKGTNDDQVDTFSYAARVVTADWTPAPLPARASRDLGEEAITRAYHAATGDGQGGDLDIMGVPY